VSGVSSLAPVVVIVDRGGSGAAVRYGATEAVRTGRALLLVHVAPPGDSWLQKVGRDSLRLALARADAEVIGRTPVRVTSLRGGLAETAHLAAHAAVVVIEQIHSGAHRRPVEPPAAALAAVTDTPVVVVPENWVERHRGVVSVGFDPDAVDTAALRAAIVLARRRRRGARHDGAGPASRAAVEERLTELGGDGCDLAVEVSLGTPVETLQLAAASSDLLVLGRHQPPRAGASRMGRLGSELLGRVTCPVLLTVPDHVHPDAVAAPGDGRGTSYDLDDDLPAQAG